MTYATAAPGGVGMGGNGPSTPVSEFPRSHVCQEKETGDPQISPIARSSSYRQQQQSISVYDHLALSFVMASLADTSVQPICQNCGTGTTPLWRRDESGSVLCNACGLFLKLHGRPRPISLKTDVIKSRNRVKAQGVGGKKRVSLVPAMQETS